MEDITFVLSCEHQGILLKVRELEEAVTVGGAGAIREALVPLEHLLSIHCRREEEVLFRELLLLPRSRTGAVADLIEEHRDGEDHFRDLHQALDAGDATGILAHGHHLLGLWREHIWKEDHTVFPDAEGVLSGPSRDRIRDGLRRIACACNVCEHAFETSTH